MPSNLPRRTSSPAGTISRRTSCSKRSPHSPGGAISVLPDEDSPASLFAARQNRRAVPRMVQIHIPTSRASLAPWLGQQPHPSSRRPVRLPASRSLQPPKTQTQRLSSLDPRRPLNSRIPSSLLNRALNGSGTVISSRKEHGWSRSVSAVAPEFPDALGRAATRLSSPKSSATQKPRFGAHDSARGSPLFLRHHNPAQRRQILPD